MNKKTKVKRTKKIIKVMQNSLKKTLEPLYNKKTDLNNIFFKLLDGFRLTLYIFSLLFSADLSAVYTFKFQTLCKEANILKTAILLLLLSP